MVHIVGCVTYSSYNLHTNHRQCFNTYIIGHTHTTIATHYGRYWANNEVTDTTHHDDGVHNDDMDPLDGLGGVTTGSLRHSLCECGVDVIIITFVASIGGTATIATTATATTKSDHNHHRRRYDSDK